MYTTSIVDGGGLLILFRMSSKDARNQHDADRVTFHRLPGFRSLSLEPRPRLDA